MLNTEIHNADLPQQQENPNTAFSGTTFTSPYALLLCEPMSSIVTNVPDRPELRSVSILGYN